MKFAVFSARNGAYDCPYAVAPNYLAEVFARLPGKGPR
jgi:hypothetical protein